MPALTPGRRPRGGVLVGGPGLGLVGGLGGLHDFGLGLPGQSHHTKIHKNDY